MVGAVSANGRNSPIVLKKSVVKPWIHSQRSILIKVDATSSP